MPAAYSYDLRKKAMEVLEEGERRETVAARFKIGKTTLWEWQQRKKETGDFQSKKLGNVGYNHKITDRNKFTEFAKKHGGKTLSEMAKLWGNVIPSPVSNKTNEKELFLPITGELSKFITCSICLPNNEYWYYSPSHNSPKRVRYRFIVVKVRMPVAYSYDLRKRVMEALDEGESGETVAKRFKIGKTTLYEWKKRREKTGDFQSKKPGSMGYNHKITDWNAFAEFANEQGGKTQSEMARLWGNISRQTIHRALKNIGFTRKKRPMDTKKEMRKSDLNLQRL